MHKRHLFLFVMLMLFIAAAVVIHANGPAHRFMRPYDKLVREQATEKQVIDQIAKPQTVLRNDAEMRHWLNRFKPLGRDSTRVEGKVFLYYADPWHDGEGAVVYVFFNKQGKVYQVSLGV